MNLQFFLGGGDANLIELQGTSSVSSSGSASIGVTRELALTSSVTSGGSATIQAGIKQIACTSSVTSGGTAALEVRRELAATSSVAASGTANATVRIRLSCGPSPNWRQEIIDAGTVTYFGADGVKSGKIHDKFCVSTGWEQGTDLAVRILVREAYGVWSGVQVGSAPSTEDACIGRINGRYCVVSASEGTSSGRRIVIHWTPEDPADLLDPDAWESTTINASVGERMFMQVEVIIIDGKEALAWGAKDDSGLVGAVGLLEYGTDPEDPDDWTINVLNEDHANWVMGFLVTYDWGGSGHPTIVWGNRQAPNGGLKGLNYNGSTWDLYTFLDTSTVSGGVFFFDRKKPPGSSSYVWYLCVQRATPRIYIITEPADPFAAAWGVATNTSLFISSSNITGFSNLSGDFKGVRVWGYDDNNDPILFLSTDLPASPSLYTQAIIRKVAGTYTAFDVANPRGEKWDHPLVLFDGTVLNTEENDNIGVVQFFPPGSFAYAKMAFGLACASSVVSDGAATIEVRRELLANSSVTAIGTASIERTVELALTSNVTCTGTATIATGNQVEFEATSSVAATGTVTIKATRQIGASAAAVSSGTATIANTDHLTLQGSSVCSSVGTASIKVRRELSGLGAAVSAGQSSVELRRELLLSSSATSSATARLLDTNFRQEESFVLVSTRRKTFNLRT